MYGTQRPRLSSDAHWNRPRGPHNPQWRPFHQPRAQFRPRNQGFNNYRQPFFSGQSGGNEEHWCETCDRGFPTEDLLNKHKQQHQKCNIDGCQFIAHPKVITKHIQMQHASGLYKKIAKLNNPEEIEKWREERKKKYPTKTNMDKKAAELKEKIERGEKMNLARRDSHNKRDGNGQNRDFNSGQSMKRPYNNVNNYQPPTRFRKKKPLPKILPITENNRSLSPFAGIQSLEMDDDDEVEENLSGDDLIDDDITIDDDSETIIHSDKSAVAKPVCSALSTLMCDYGSSDEETDDVETTKHVKNDKVGVKTQNRSMLDKLNKAGRDISKENNSYIINTVKTEKELPQSGTGPNKVSLDTKTGQSIDCKSTVEVHMNEKSVKNDISIKSDELAVGENNKPNPSMKTSENIEDDDSAPEEVKVEKKDESLKISQENNTQKNIEKKKVDVVRKKTIYRKPKPKLPSTLIYRLLSKEMKQERNQVLQCIRYIRKHNYFDKSNTS